jgi:hypothetical protein
MTTASSSRKMRRAAAKEAAKKNPPGPQKTLKQYCTELAQIVGEMQVSMNALYMILLDKEVLTAEEFKQKHKEVLDTLRGIKQPAPVIDSPAVTAAEPAAVTE